MHLVPIREDQANRRHWVVKALRFVGYIQVIVDMIIGFAVGSTFIASVLREQFYFSRDGASLFGSVIGIALGFCMGMWLTLTVWGLALVIDDIHAIRMNTAGYYTSDPQDTPYTSEDNLHFIGEVPPQFNYKNRRQQ